MAFQPVAKDLDIQAVEQEQLDFWQTNRVFQRTTEGRDDAPRYVFYEGPPTANGRPGTHHVLARAFKDLFPRYKVMQGFYCERRGGWDTHGLPVEIAIEKELGIEDKSQIEEYGVAEFNAMCRKRVFSNIADWEKFTERIGYWVDLDNAYITFTNDYIESVWWILKQFWEKKLLYRDYKVIAYSPSSGTPLSSHEVAQGYQTVTDPSVYVRFPLKDEDGVYFLAWTTTPWTLPGNAALAVGPDVDYVQVKGPLPHSDGTEQLILAESLLEDALQEPENYEVVKRMKGKELVGMRYNPLYQFLPTDKDFAYVLPGDFVSMDDGSGIVHIAPAFGQDDSELGKEHDLPVFITVNDDGRFVDAVDKFKGLWFKDADREIIDDLKGRGLLFRRENYTHEYPHNWRDDKPLMYLARETWFIRTTDYKDKMIELNNTVNWVPDHIQQGRFGNWLEGLKEWALGRERYWGTPLPVWVDDETGDMLCVGSVEELEEYTGQDLTELDLHRPYVDEITFPNPNGSGGTMRRVPEVIDVWFDSGAMPVAQWGYPQHDDNNRFADQYPADYICEAVDQTRGWFYSLHSIASMLFEDVAYKNVICLGLLLDEDGKKMSKSRGNAVDPWDVLNQHGADAFRWYMYTSGPPGEPRRFSVRLVGEVVKKLYLTLWNTYKFFVEYANLDEWTPANDAPPVAERPLLDRWVLSELHRVVKEVTEGYETYDVAQATRPVDEFVDTLSNWYVRLSRERFWRQEKNDPDKLSAYATLYECLTTIAHLLAPAMPFLGEKLYRELVTAVNEDAPDSVHLAQWPVANDALIDETLLNEMTLVRRLVSLGNSARNSVEITGRQPLQSVSFSVSNATERNAVRKYDDLIKEELNVKQVDFLQEDEEVTSYTLSPVYAKLGAKLRGDMKAVASQLENADDEQTTAWALTLLDDESITVEASGKTFELASDEVEVRQESAAEGFAVMQERGYVAALDTNLTPELINERYAREFVRRVQVARKNADFNIEDRIILRYEASDALAEAIEAHADYVKSETLALSMEQAAHEQGFYTEDFSDDLRGDLEDETLVVSVKRAD